MRIKGIDFLFPHSLFSGGGGQWSVSARQLRLKLRRPVAVASAEDGGSYQWSVVSCQWGHFGQKRRFVGPAYRDLESAGFDFIGRPG